VEGPGPACSAMALGKPTRAKNSYFRRVRSALSTGLATYERRCSQKLMETDPHADGVAGCFEDDDLGVA
jgi:hypothetical protein